MLDTAVALTIYDRPDLTERVFGVISQVEPKTLFVIADGPRSRNEEEVCARARNVIDTVDWPCDLHLDFSDVNLGCRRRCTSGFDWVFRRVDSAIFLEDDCVPDPTFFPFCEAMLERYREDPRIMMITGSNYVERWKANRQSYHFSHFGAPGGWASWRRAWALYDDTMQWWGDEQVRARIRALIADDEIFDFQARRFDRVFADPANRHVWDLQWSFARLLHDGLTIIPAVNLYCHKGNSDGRGLPPAHPLANLRTFPMAFPLRFHSSVSVDRRYDALHVRRIYEWYARPAERRSLRGRGFARIRRIARAVRVSRRTTA
jgi:hypothetical protein